MARFTKPKAKPGITLTERDITIIKAVYRYRFLSTDQAQVLTGSKSRTKLNARLAELWGADFLDRPEVQKELFAYADKRPTVHALGDAGADWLRDNYGVRFPQSINWRQKNRGIKSGEFIKHTLGTTGMMLRIERDFTEANGFRFVDRDDVWFNSPQYTPEREMPKKLPTQYEWLDGAVVRKNTEPDYVFVGSDERGEEAVQVLYFPEYDRNSEDYVRTSPWRSSIVGKFFGYADAWQRHLTDHLYGHKRFRVPFVVKDNDEARVEKMVETYQKYAANRIPAGALLFTTEEKLHRDGFLAPIWLDGRGETVSLHDAKPPAMPVQRQPELLRN